MHPADTDPKRDIVAMLEASCEGRIAALLPLRACVASYRARILAYSQLHVLGIWHSRIRVADLPEKELTGEVRARAAALVAKARNRTHDQVFEKLVKRDAAGRWRFADDPPRSVLEPYVGKSAYEHHGQRVVCGQRLMQASSDMFLGWSAAVPGR